MAAKTTWRRRCLVFLGGLLAVVLLWAFLQYIFPHRHRAFHPDYDQVDLVPLLAREDRSEEDYRAILLQTGLSRTAVDQLLARGEAGVRQVLDTQEAFFSPPGQDICGPLGITTREHRFRNEEGCLVPAFPLAPLEPGDILVSFSTHTAGWRHGHAGLVVDPDQRHPRTLESVVLGTCSDVMDGNHWRCYTTFMLLRPKGTEEATGAQAAALAMDKLVDIPYSLVSGVFGDKLQPLDGPHSAHCGYLPWYAWAALGVDLDGDGGRVVAPEDLSISDNVEVIQVYGIDPAQVFPGDG